MIYTDKRTFVIILAGLIWGLSGFTVEIIPEDAFQLQLVFRLVLILISSFVIYLSLPFSIKKNNLLTIFLLLCYLFFFSASTILNNASLTYLIREIILLYSCITIIIVISSEEKILNNFITGLYLALVLLGFFYFININFSEIFSLLYRLRTNLNPNGIGMMAVMLFSIGLNGYYIGKKKGERAFHIMAFSIAIIVVIATRSRTSLAMMTAAFVLLNLLYKKKYTLMATILVGSLVVLYNLDAFEKVIRLTTPADYSGNKTLANLTGRTDLWKQGIQIIYNNFLFGIGADKAVVKVGGHWGSFHNAYIQLLVTGGIMTFIPLLILIILAIKRSLLLKDQYLLIIIFVTGLMGSFLESRLLNFGSPGNLLFLISFLYLSRLNTYARNNNTNRKYQLSAPKYLRTDEF